MSSYEENNYGGLFETLAKKCNTPIAVELGVLHGYSTEHIAKGIAGKGRLIAYDLFEEYEFNHSQFETVKARLSNFKDVIELVQGDAFIAHTYFADESIGLLHVDLSNNGDILKKIVENWNKKIAPGGLLIFEGGSVVRDNVEWMRKYKKPPIRPELESNKIINDQYLWGVFEAFPSITVMYKKRGEV